MRRLLIPILALALGGVGSTPASAITFGEPDGALHPNVGVVVTDRSEGSPGPDITCSGTLIAERVFLTVAHCIDVVEGAGEPLFVSFDSAYDEEAASPSGLFAGSAIKHPLWGSTGRADPYDMAVILLESSPGITPAALPTAGLLDLLAENDQLKNQRFTTVGYGAVRSDKNGGSHALEGRDGLRRYASEGFQSLRPSLLALSQNPSTGEGGTCRGDSGGPHFLGGVTSNLVVATTLDTDTWCRASGTAYRLDTATARSFLAQFVKLP